MDRETAYRARAAELANHAERTPSAEERQELERLVKSWLALADQAGRDKARGV